MQKPRKLQPGDKVMTVSLSWGGPHAVPHRYQAGKQQLEAFGVEVVESRHALRAPEWLANNPQARADDLMEAFADPSVKAIISTIGGDDSIRLLPWLDLDVIRANPKIFMGFSDTTISHFACFAAGLVSFYGPAIMAGFAENGGMLPYTAASVQQTLFSTEPIGLIEPCPTGWTDEYLDWRVLENQARPRQKNPSTGWKFLQGEGITQGPLIGGCIEVIEWLKETPVWPTKEAWDGAILFLEISEEALPAAAVTRILRTYAAIGLLERLSGILFGRPAGQTPLDKFATYDQALLQVVAREQGLTHLPIITQMDFGHTEPMFVLPYGVTAQIDCTKQSFSIIESAVSE